MWIGYSQQHHAPMEEMEESSSDVVSMQMEAAMETALIEVASHYVNVIQALKDERDDAFARAAKSAWKVMKSP